MRGVHVLEWVRRARSSKDRARGFEPRDPGSIPGGPKFWLTYKKAQVTLKYFRKGRLLSSGGMLLLASAILAAPSEVPRPASLSADLGRKALATLSAQAKSPDPETRAAVAAAWGDIANPAALPLLKKASGDPDAYVRIEAAASLHKLGSPDGVRLLEAMVGRSSATAERLTPADEMKQLARNKIRAAAIIKLGDMGSERVVGLLEKTLKDPSGPVRDATGIALCRLGLDEFADQFLKALEDQDDSVRAAAVIALGQTGLPLVLDALRQASSDQAASVRAEAMKALGGYPAGEVLEDLKRGLKDDHPRVRLLAASALARLNDRSIIPVLLAQVKDGADPGVRLAALKGLAAQGEKVDLTLAARQLSSKDIDGRLLALETLAAVRTGPAFEMLGGMLDADPSTRVRVHAAKLLIMSSRGAGRP